MKTLLRFLILMIPVSLFLTFTACSDDDKIEPEDQDNTGTGDNTGGNTGDNTGGNTGGTTVDDDYPYYSQFDIPSAEDNLGETLAFPGAEGGGMYVTGGRGGTVYHVTNLEDNGTGSFRAAVTSSGPRIVVFDVAGTIELKSELRIRNGDLTILGQTAPGDGITIGYDTVYLDADNVIIRFVRFRLSDSGGNSDLGDGSDCIWGRYHQNIILDHCTMSWSIDECASFYANKNFTMQWCMISEALNQSRFHSKDGHGYGGIWGGRNASFHHNLLAHNYSRNARIDHPGLYSNGTYLPTHRGNVDYRNNVIYNWQNDNTYGGEDGWFNIVGNYYKPGPASAEKNRQYIVHAYWDNDNSNGYQSSAFPELYLTDNYKTDGWNSAYPNGVYYDGEDSSHSYVQLTSPLSIKADDATTCHVTTHSYSNAYSKVLDYVGASLVRDEVDTRVINETKNGTSSLGTNGIIASMEGENYFPTLDGGTADTDTDGDGMPDWFEDQFGLDANDASDAATKTLDKYGRYTNLEMYAHYLVKDIVTGQNASGTYTALD